MPDLTTAIRARLEAAAPHLAGCEIQAVRRDPASNWVPVRDLVRHAPDDLAALLAELERLQAALEDQPPAADAALLASANRMLCERLEAAEGERDEAVGRMQQVVYEALVGPAEERFGSEAAGVIDGGGSDGDEYDFTSTEVSACIGLYEDALDEATERADTAERALAEARAEVERMRGHVSTAAMLLRVYDCARVQPLDFTDGVALERAACRWFVDAGIEWPNDDAAFDAVHAYSTPEPPAEDATP